MSIDRLPTLAEVNKADAEQLARWYRFLLPDNAEQETILEKISAQLKKAGGMTPALSRKIGYAAFRTSASPPRVPFPSAWPSQTWIVRNETPCSCHHLRKTRAVTLRFGDFECLGGQLVPELIAADVDGRSQPCTL